jgi:hypothetical protein
MTTTIATRILLPALALAALFSFAAVPAQAQLARTFVSNAIGNDANNCDRPTPCRTFQAAHDKTLAAGEITVLDPGGYGAVTITKAISITNDGVGEAGVLVSGGVAGITISAGDSDAVSLRGLTIKGIGFGGGNGIVFTGGKSLSIENCIVRTLTGAASGVGFGIAIRPGTAFPTVTVMNTLVAQNENIGIQFQPTSSAIVVKGLLDRVAAYDNGDAGVAVQHPDGSGFVQITALDSIASGNATEGFTVHATNPGNSSLVLIRSTSANNGKEGIKVAHTGAGIAILRVGQSTITGNGSSWSATGTLQSFGDNNIIGNGDGDPAIVAVIGKT